MRNNKNFTPLCMAKHLISWVVSHLLNRPDAVVYAHPIKRDVHLNSTEAIRNWLATIDRPNSSKQSDTETKGGGASPGEEE